MIQTSSTMTEHSTALLSDEPRSATMRAPRMCR